MKKFMLLHIGFVKPTPELMRTWNDWFASIAKHQVDQGGFNGGREISKQGTKNIPWDHESITGFNIIEAENLDAAEKLANNNPYVTSIRVYELR